MRSELAQRHGLAALLARQRAWSLATFGPGNRTAGLLDHIHKELREIEAEPLSLEEWIDVAILAFDGAWRAGHSPEAIAEAWLGKQTKNEARDWPDWRTMPADKAIEHIRGKVMAEPREIDTEHNWFWHQGYHDGLDGLRAIAPDEVRYSFQRSDYFAGYAAGAEDLAGLDDLNGDFPPDFHPSTPEDEER